MEEFDREKALKKKAEIEFKLNSESINKASLEVEDDML